MLPSLREIVHPSLLRSIRQGSPTKEPMKPTTTVPGTVIRLGCVQPRVAHQYPKDTSPSATFLAPSKQCSYPGCIKRARVFGKCCAHGGKHICSHPGCNKCARAGGRCIKHGGGARCAIKDCNKAVQSGGVCYAHREFRKEK